MTNTIELEKIIEEKGLKKNWLAKQMNLSPYGLQLKIENKRQFKQDEIIILGDLLGISTLKDRDKFFFNRV